MFTWQLGALPWLSWHCRDHQKTFAIRGRELIIRSFNYTDSSYSGLASSLLCLACSYLRVFSQTAVPCAWNAFSKTLCIVSLHPSDLCPNATSLEEFKNFPLTSSFFLSPTRPFPFFVAILSSEITVCVGWFPHSLSPHRSVSSKGQEHCLVHTEYSAWPSAGTQ